MIFYARSEKAASQTIKKHLSEVAFVPFLLGQKFHVRSGVSPRVLSFAQLRRLSSMIFGTRAIFLIVCAEREQFVCSQFSIIARARLEFKMPAS